MNAATAWIELETSASLGPQAVLDGACLTIERGQFVVVMGRSGSGKSTLLRLIGGLESPDAGVVRVDGKDLRRCRRPSARCGGGTSSASCSSSSTWFRR